MSCACLAQWREVALNQGGKWTLPQLTAAALAGMVQQGKLYEYDSFASEPSYPPAGQAGFPHSDANSSPTLTLPHHASRPRTMSSDRVASPTAQQLSGVVHGAFGANGSVPGSPSATSRLGRGGVGDGGGGGGGVGMSRDGSGGRGRPRSAGLMVLSPYLGRVRCSPRDGLAVNSGKHWQLAGPGVTPSTCLTLSARQRHPEALSIAYCYRMPLLGLVYAISIAMS